VLLSSHVTSAVNPGAGQLCAAHGFTGDANVCCANVQSDITSQNAAIAQVRLSTQTCATCISNNVCPVGNGDYVVLNSQLWDCFSGGVADRDALSHVSVTYCSATLNGGAVAMVLILSLLGFGLLLLLFCFCCPCCPVAQRRARRRNAPPPLAPPSLHPTLGPYVGYGSPQKGGLLGITLGEIGPDGYGRQRTPAGLLPSPMPVPVALAESPRYEMRYEMPSSFTAPASPGSPASPRYAASGTTPRR